MLTKTERGAVIFGLEEYAKALESGGYYSEKNTVLELIWKLCATKGAW